MTKDETTAITVANTASADEVVKTPSLLESMLPFVLIMVVFYIFIIRPQSKKAQEHHDMVSNLTIGKEIVTNGGIVGVILSIDQESKTATLALEEGSAKIRLDMIAEVLSVDANKPLANTSKDSKAKDSVKKKLSDAKKSKSLKKKA